MDSNDVELLHLTVELWHPSCWTLETTREAEAGLYAHTTVPAAESSVGLYTVYGRSRDALSALTDGVRESSLTESVTVLPPSTGPLVSTGSATRRVLVEFDSAPSIRRAFTSRGFVHYGPTRHEGGRERRSLLVRSDRPSVRRALDEVESEYDADICVHSLTTVASECGPPARSGEAAEPALGGHLSSRQREAFLLARSRGYYEYPRATTARALASDLGISKTTFLEHLRKAEAKLLNGIDPF
ncbi:helix-turn-helix domain-containing protein [Natronorarus salvus]|uniref:helix-turn-helix domain-containing protein n=1 Tax=Natronorarus salvus TaxID=3117733 RepID=UPI002F26AA98